MVGVAVNVTKVPAQIVVAVTPILTDGVILAFTVITILLLVPDEVVKQVALLVMMQVTASALFKDELLNTLLLVPVFDPFIFH